MKQAPGPAHLDHRQAERCAQDHGRQEAGQARRQDPDRIIGPALPGANSGEGAPALLGRARAIAGVRRVWVRAIGRERILATEAACRP